MFKYYPLCYKGNKYIETKKYLKNLDIMEYDIIAEPFGGIYGFSRAMSEMNPDFKGEFWINDLNKELIKFHIGLKLNSYEYYKNKVEELLEKFKTESELSTYLRKEIKNGDAEACILFMMVRGMNEGVVNFKNTLAKIKNFKIVKDIYVEKLKQFSFSNDDFKTFIEKLPKDKKILIYFDPPYFMSNNTTYASDKYEKGTKILKDNTKIYLDILEYMKKEYKFIMITNDNAIMRFVYKDYIKSSYNQIYQMNKKKTNHLIISNII